MKKIMLIALSLGALATIDINAAARAKYEEASKRFEALIAKRRAKAARQKKYAFRILNSSDIYLGVEFYPKGFMGRPTFSRIAPDTEEYFIILDAANLNEARSIARTYTKFFTAQEKDVFTKSLYKDPIKVDTSKIDVSDVSNINTEDIPMTLHLHTYVFGINSIIGSLTSGSL